MSTLDLFGLLSSQEIAGLTAFGEARGEPVEGQIAVLNVIANRARIRGLNLTTICLAPRQFSCWNDDPEDENHNLLLRVAEGLTKGREDVTYPVLGQCLGLAQLTATGLLLDNVAGATHYLTKGLYRAAPPVWTVGHSPVAEVGHHLFFAGIAPFIPQPIRK